MRLAALLFCGKCILVPVTTYVIGHAIFDHDSQMAFAGLALLAVTCVVTIAQWLVAMRTNCPLCLTPVLAVKNCAKHRRALTLFGSHRLRVALAILFKQSFRCPYCHEPTELEVRKKRTP